MTTSGAKKHMEKVLEFVTERMESKVSMYGNTKEQLLEIAKLGRDISDIITNNIDSIPNRGEPKNTKNELEETIGRILEEKLDKVLDEKLGKVLDEKIGKALDERLGKVKKSKKDTKPDKEDSVPESESAQNPPESNETEEVKQVEVLPEIKNKAEHISPLTAKSVLRSYAKVLEKSAEQHSDIKSVNLCRDLIWRWFDSRILHKKGKFRYSVVNFNKYIYAIVVCFGYHMEHNSLTKFITGFDEWIEKVSVEGEYADKFALPYEVNTVYRNKKDLSEEKKKEQETYANNTSAVLWDVLWDESYSELQNVNLKPSAKLHECGVWEMIKKLNINVLDDYLDYRVYPDVLTSLCIA